MNQSSICSSGLELADLVVTSGLLHTSWASISELQREINSNLQPFLPLSVRYKVYQQPPLNHTVIAFAPSPTCSADHLESDLVSSTTLKETCPIFEFLCSEGNPSFSIHKTAITLFASLLDELTTLKTQFGNSTPLIITGLSIGGSIASLFTLWLLASLSPYSGKRLLCITYGSPLLGNNGLRQAILESSMWNSCFLHVASDGDPIPRLFASTQNFPAVGLTPQTGDYKPFGTFLLCSESGCACFEDSESILQLLVIMGLEQIRRHGRLQDVNYGQIVDHLNCKMVCRRISDLSEWIRHPLRAGLTLQLETIGIKWTQYIDLNPLIKSMEDFVTCKRKVIHPSKKLNDIKINMAKLEWYKKDSMAKGIGYYDTYKNLQSRKDMKVVQYKKILTNYWKDMVAEAERKPQKEGAPFQIRWLYAGTNYRRMVEPLDIADYCREHSPKDYLTRGRSGHYILLEQWQKEEERRLGDQDNANERKAACSLTVDSCFWAHVEEAIASLGLLSSSESSPLDKESSRGNLIDFENYVMELIKNNAVSPEIFLEQSSFMQWWHEYEKAIATTHNSPFVVHMKNHIYRRYC